MSDDLSELKRIYGLNNCLMATCCIIDSTDIKGLKVVIPITYKRVEAILEAVHGETILHQLKKYA